MRKKIKKLFKRLGFISDMFGGKLSIAKAQLGATVIRANGDVEELGVISEKLVTDAFVEDICEALAGNTIGTFDDYKYHASGTDNTSEDNTDTSLGTEVASRESGTQVVGGSQGAREYESVATINYSSSHAITEHGLFNDNSSGTMMDRSVVSAINVENGDSIQFTYTLTINAET